MTENQKLKDDNEKLRKDNQKMQDEMKNYGMLIKDLMCDNEKLKTDIDEINRKINQIIENQPKNEADVNSKEKASVGTKNEADAQRFIHKEGIEFNGIMRHLSDVTNGNIHANNTIEITSNSIRYDSEHPKNLVDYSSGHSYISKERSSVLPFVCFDFKDKSVRPTQYSIRSGSSCYNAYLRNWVVEVSQDNKNWTEIDHRKEDSNLKGKLLVYTFDIQNKPVNFYRYIRLRLTGKTWCNQDDNLVVIRKVDFYGELQIH